MTPHAQPMPADAFEGATLCDVCGTESCEIHLPAEAASAPTLTAHRSTPALDPLTEAGAAERFARLHGDDVRHDKRRNLWLLWNGQRWTPDTDAAITRLGLDFTRDYQRKALNISDSQRRRETLAAALKLERREALMSMLRLAADLKPIADSGDGWDTHPWLLGTPDGVVDLRTGDRRPAAREDRITLSTSVEYDEAATSTLWDETLRSILVTSSVLDFVQAAIGYSATGDTRRDAWFLAQGSGRNGKGTLIHPVQRVLGDYAVELPAACLDARRDSLPYDLAVLPGRRFVVSSESGDSIRLNHDRIKQITGGDRIRAANKYEKSVEFECTAKLWLSANKTPRVTDDSPAFWARVMLVPFPVSFVGREDRNLRPTLEREPEHQAGILAWIVQGAVRYYRYGLDPPDAVTAATRVYELECDPLADFLDAMCIPDPDAEIGAADFYQHYRRWAEEHGLGERERLTATAFGRRMGERFKSLKRNTGKVYLGVARRCA